MDEDDTTNVLETVVEVYTNFNAAFKAMGLDKDEKFSGQIAAVLNDKGTAEYVVMNCMPDTEVEIDDGSNPSSKNVTINVGTKTGTGRAVVEINGKEYTITESSADTAIKVSTENSVTVKVTGVGADYDPDKTTVSVNGKGAAMKDKNGAYRLIDLAEGDVVVITPVKITPIA